MHDINAHPAVAFLQTTEFWPKGYVWRFGSLELPGYGNTQFGGEETLILPTDRMHDTIFAAAVRWLWSVRKDVFCRKHNQEWECFISDEATSLEELVRFGPTDLHAMLDAVEAARKEPK